MDKYKDKLHIIRYEELVTSPQKVLLNLGDLLQIDPDNFNHRIVHARSVGKYRQGLTDRELSEVIEVAGPTMIHLGYSL